VLYPYRDVAPVIQVETIPVSQQKSLVQASQALALNIKVQAADTFYRDFFFVSHQAGPAEYRFADIICRAKVLFIRRNLVGEIISLQAYAAEQLQIAGHTLLESFNKPVSLNYRQTSRHPETFPDLKRAAA
jgi:hypothetical protein